MDFLVFAVIPVFAFFVILAIASRQKKINQAWQEAASQLGLQLRPAAMFSARQIFGVYDGYPVIVDTWSTGGKNSKTYTRYCVQFPEPLGLGLKLTRQHFFSGVAKLFGAQDIEVGDNTFDDTVVVKGFDVGQVTAFLTPSRRLRIARLLTAHHACEIGDEGLHWSARGVESNTAALVANVRHTLRAAMHLATDRAEDETLDHAISVQSDGQLQEALDIVRSVPRRAELPDVDTQVLEGEILYTAGRFSEAADVLRQAHQDSPADDEVGQWAKHATEMAQSAETPQPTAAGPDVKSLCEKLFGPDNLSYETNRLFEENYQGATVNWSGVLRRANSCTYDLVFGSSACTKAVLEIHELASVTYGNRTIQAVVQLPPEDLDVLHDRSGQPVQFRGRLVSCDPFMRNLFVADAELLEPRPGAR